jgi:gliding motility-associated protein GldC
MRNSNIELTVSLDSNNIPETIDWSATDFADGKPQPTKAFALSIWDADHKSIMKIDLWNKEMEVAEMKMFAIQCIGGLGDTLFSATGDEDMQREIHQLCDKLAAILKKQQEEARQ